MELDTGQSGVVSSVAYDRIEKGYRLEQIYQLKLTNGEILAICKILLESRAFCKEEMSDILGKLISCCVPENNQKLVTELAYVISSADGNFGEEEKNAIAAYCQEMQIEFQQEKDVRPMADIIEGLSDFGDLISRKIIIFEAIGLAMVDGNYDKKEREIIEHLMAAFHLEMDYARRCEAIISKYIEISDKIKKLVIG